MTRKKLSFTFLVLFLSTIIYAQDCSNSDFTNGNLNGAAPFCSDTGLTFCNSLLLDQINGTSNAVPSAEPGPAYGCLGSQPFPSWFFIRIDEPGDLALTISQNTVGGAGVDVDFIIWGPYTQAEINSIQGGNTSLLNAASIQDCSFLPDAVEFLNVNAVANGEFYVILITNFDGQPGTIEMVNTNPSDPNAGSTDCSIVAGELGPDQEVCEGEVVTLDGTPSIGAPTDYTYQWSLDTGSGFVDLAGQTNPTIDIGTSVPGISGTYRIEVTDMSNNMDSDEVLITFQPPPTVADPVLLEACSLNENGFFSFDLTSANTLISANAANETFRYFETELGAQTANSAEEITTPTNYTNQVETNDAIWVRTTSTLGCFSVSRIDLEVSSIVVPNTFQRIYDQCDDYLDANGDDNTNNDDTDGITTFNFSDITADIIALFPAAQQANITVTYYETIANANAAVDAISDISNHRNINFPNSQQIFVRVENSANNTCLYTGTHITLITGEVPASNAVADLDLCDDDADGDDTNGFLQNIDLESQTAGILGTQDPSQFTVTYHESAADATANTGALASPFTNTTVNTQTIYVRVTNNTSGCFTDRNSFNVNIRPLPVVTASVELRQCDDDTDGFSPFNLFEAGELISTNSTNETFEFFETLADAQAGMNQISNPTAYTNQVVTTDMVWARAISSFGCFRISEVTLTVATNSSQVTTFPPRSYNTCDDFLDINGDDNANNDDTDGVSSFDFSDFTDDIINAFPVSERPFLTVEYYRNSDDALAELNQIADASNYRNIGYPNTQDIYVRVDNSQNNECIGFFPLITLIVDPVPVANPVPDLEQCDNADDGDFSNGIIQTFNLESRTPGILGTQNPNIYTVTYHTRASDASLGINPITNTTAYTNTTANQQTIYVRVTHNVQGCYVDRLTFDLIVNPLPTANFVEDLEVCDDGTATSAQNGLTSNIDLELQTAGILGTQDPANFTVTYHASLIHAQAGVLSLSSPYANTTPFSQTIYVRIVNNTTGCVNDISNFNVIINTRPTVENITTLPVCDDNLDGDDTNGFVQNINLDAQIPIILGPDQDEDDFTVTFHEDPTDLDTGANPLSSPYSNSVAGGQPIYVRVINDDTGCINQSLVMQLVVNPLPDFTVISPQIVCLNGPELTLEVQNPSGVYDYVWTDPDGNELIGSQITVSTGGIYLVTATATDGTGCTRTREIRVNESIIATITDADVSIVDDSENNTITIDPTNIGIGDYEYALNDEFGNVVRDYQDSPVFENLEGGFYTILVRDKNGCGVATLDTSVVEFPKFFTPNNDGVNDTWAIKGANSTFFPNSEVNIFNRFGKVVAQINIDNPGWNGTFNGKVLPSDDYWFSIKLTDRNGVVRERTGNVSLLRR